MAVAGPDISTERRDGVVALLTRALQAAVPASRVSWRGSLAAGTADEYSDIDLLWVVPEGAFPAALEVVPSALASVAPVFLLRADPALAASDRRRLLFAHLRGLPLFWRIDLDVRAEVVAGSDDYDSDNPAARDDSGWNGAASALANAVAAVKALRRGRPEEAVGLVGRGLERVGRDPGGVLDARAALPVLVDACVAYDPGVREFAAEVSLLVRTLGPTP